MSICYSGAPRHTAFLAGHGRGGVSGVRDFDFLNTSLASLGPQPWQSVCPGVRTPLPSMLTGKKGKEHIYLLMTYHGPRTSVTMRIKMM